jgi:hypothetical protein
MRNLGGFFETYGFDMKTTQFLESAEEFKVSFGGKNSIDAELFTKTINDTISLVKESANAIDPNCFIRLEIKTNESGSFQTIIDVITKHIPDLINNCIPLANDILQGVLNFILIKQHLKGRKAKEIIHENDKMVIKNKNGEDLLVPDNMGNAFFENNKIDKLIVNITTHLKESSRENMSIKTKEDEIVIDKEEYDDMGISVVDENPTAKTVTNSPVEAQLLVKKPDLLGKSKWEFIYNKKIEAKIEDNEFLDKVRKGEIKNLYAGVRLPCILQFEYELDENHDIVPNSDRYTILRLQE